MGNGPRTTREALVAELLGDIDGLLARCEAFTGKVEVLTAQLASNTATLDAAGERYRIAAVAFTEQAKQEVIRFLERKASEVSAQMLDAQRAELQAAVLRVLESAASEAVTRSAPRWQRLTELAGVAIGAGISGAGLVYWLLH